MSLNTDIINTIDIPQWHTPVSVTILEENKFDRGTYSYKSLGDFIDYFTPAFEKGNYCFNGGNDREFYITNELEDNFTIQVSPFEFDDEEIDLWSVR